MKTRLVAVVGALIMVVAGGACGDDSGGRPSKSELSDTIVEQLDVERAEGDCIADELLASDLSDKVLTAIADDDESDVDDDEQEEAIEVIGKATADCASGG